MQTLTQLLTEYLDVTKDNTTANRIRGTRRMNERQRVLVAKKPYWWREKEVVLQTVASQQQYPITVTSEKIMGVRHNNGSGRDTILEEIPSPSRFDEINRESTTVTSDYPIYWHERDGNIYLYPTPSSTGDDITILYKRRLRNMSLEDYTTGTIAVIMDDQTVVGSGTSWVSAGVKPGSYIFIDDIPYEVGSVTDATHLELVKPYEGSIASGLSYKVGDVPAIPEPFHDLLWMDACLHYDFKKESSRVREIKVLRDELEFELQKFGQSRSTRNVISKRKYRLRNINDYPENIG